MRHSGTLNYRTSARRNNRRTTIASGSHGPFLFIVTAIIVAGIGATLIRSYQNELSSILAPKTAIVFPQFGVTTTPHDDICYDVFDNFSGEQNIKGFFEYHKMDSGCIARQMSNGAKSPGQD